LLTQQLEVVSITDTGLIRKINEDAVRTVPELGLLVLADGMGGYNAGEVASRLAVDLVVEQLTTILKDAKTGAGLRRKAKQVVFQANNAIFHGGRHMDSLEGMGTTLVIAILGDGFLFHAHIGDSRLYRYRAGELLQITRDHTTLQDMVDLEIFPTAEEAKAAGVPGNVLTRALGTSLNEPELSTKLTAREEGDIYLLCSDGLSDMVSDELISNQIKECGKDLDMMAKRLVALACQAGGRDNISVILARAL